MPFTYQILCTAPNCPAPATHKIAARWTDGLTEELKTYGLTCEEHLPRAYRESMKKQKACRLVDGEVLDTPAIFLLKRDDQAKPPQRLVDLEKQIMSD